jgi:hypothetical protein
MKARPVHLIDEQLSDRDQNILLDLARVRVLSGNGIDRLHFAHLSSSHSRSNVRSRVMKRLIDGGFVSALDRRIGGARAGSAGLIYTLDRAGQRWVAIAEGHGSDRVRRLWPVGTAFLAHTLDVAELYVRLRESERRGGELRLAQFDADPASWHRTGLAVLKPDAYAVWTKGGWEYHRWLEVDRGTESLPTLRRKLLGYLDAINGGDTGPSGVPPEVLVTVRTDRRLTEVRRLISDLPPPSEALISVQLFDEAFRLPPTTERPPPPVA